MQRIGPHQFRRLRWLPLGPSQVPRLGQVIHVRLHNFRQLIRARSSWHLTSSDSVSNSKLNSSKPGKEMRLRLRRHQRVQTQAQQHRHSRQHLKVLVQRSLVLMTRKTLSGTLKPQTKTRQS